MSASLADKLQAWGFEEDFIIFSDGSVGFGMEANPIDTTCFSDDQVNQLSQSLVQFLNGLPDNINLQFIQEILPGNEDTVFRYEQSQATDSSALSQIVAQKRIERLRELDQQGQIPVHGLKIFVRRPTSKPLLSKPRLFSKSKEFETMAEEVFKRELIQTGQLRDQLSQELCSLGLTTVCIKKETILKFLYYQWNPSRPIDMGVVDPEDIRFSLLLTDAVISEKGFSLGDMHHRILSLKVLPDHTFASMASILRGLPFGSKLFLTIHVPNQAKEISNLQLQRRLAFSMARGKKTGVSDIESEAKLQDLESLLENMIAQGEKVFQVSLNILLCHRQREILESQVAQSLAVIREMGGSEAMEESLASFDIFCDIAIPNARGKERAKRIKTSNLCDLLPIYGPWKGHEKPSLLLRSRFGSLVAFDPFSPNFSNYNQIVSGGSGSGKSFLVNIFLLQMLKENPRIFIIDIGGSYAKLSDNLGGQYVPLGTTADSINPFDLAIGETTPSNSKIKFLVGLIEIMTKEEDESNLKRLERAQIEEAIQLVYETSTVPSLSVLKDILTRSQDIEMRRLARILSIWCGNSPYGQFIDRPTTIKLHCHIVCFDLKGMESNPDLQAVCLYVLTNFVWQEVQKDRSTRKFLIFDECWKLLENDAGSTFIAEVFRTFRKYYASAIAISQNIDDFAKSRVSTAILTNSAVKWLLMQKGADQARIKEVLQLNDNEMKLVASLYQERGLFSEAFLIAQDQRAVVLVEPTPLEYWLATTDPRDLGKISEVKSQNPEKSELSILEVLASTHPKGLAAQKELVS